MRQYLQRRSFKCSSASGKCDERDKYAFKNVPVQRDKKPKRRNGNINKEAAVRFEHVETGKT